MLANLFDKKDKKSTFKSGSIPSKDFFPFNDSDLATVLGGGEEVKSIPSFKNTSFSYESQFNVVNTNG